MYIGKFGNLKLKVKSSTEIQHGKYIQTALVYRHVWWVLESCTVSVAMAYRDALSPSAERAAVPNRYGGVASFSVSSDT